MVNGITLTWQSAPAARKWRDLTKDCALQNWSSCMHAQVLLDQFHCSGDPEFSSNSDFQVCRTLFHSRIRVRGSKRTGEAIRREFFARDRSWTHPE